VVSVVVPTYNEADNIPILVRRLRTDLADLDYEIIIVDDDSPDRTWQVAHDTVADDPRFHVVRRRGERGLSSAVLAGMGIADGSILVVMDADLQHDTATIPVLVSTMMDNDLDICVASREATGGSYGSFGRRRRLVSWLGATVARLAIRVPLSDPMSGFFAVSRHRYQTVEDELNPLGFKILLEFMVRGPRPRVDEVGYRFGRRLHGATKLSSRVAVDYLRAVVELAVGRHGSATTVVYGVVVAVTLLLQALTSWLAHAVAARSIATGLGLELAALAAYYGHNTFTFTHGRHQGLAHRTGLARFHAVACYGWIVHGSVTALLAPPSSAGSNPDGPVVALLRSLQPTVDAAYIIGLVVGSVATYQLYRHLVWGSATGLKAGGR
jgi:dolichol-phosphate mannosyltransferase